MEYRDAERRVAAEGVPAVPAQQEDSIDLLQLGILLALAELHEAKRVERIVEDRPGK